MLFWILFGYLFSKSPYLSAKVLSTSPHIIALIGVSWKLVVVISIVVHATLWTRMSVRLPVLSLVVSSSPFKMLMWMRLGRRFQHAKLWTCLFAHPFKVFFKNLQLLWRSTNVLEFKNRSTNNTPELIDHHLTVKNEF